MIVKHDEYRKNTSRGQCKKYVTPLLTHVFLALTPRNDLVQMYSLSTGLFFSTTFMTAVLETANDIHVT